MSEAISVFASPSPRVRRVAVDRPWSWLARGWADVLTGWRVSLAYGALIAAVSLGFVLGLVLSGYVFLVLPFAAGFMLVAPVLAVGLYETSRRLSAGQPVSLRAAVLAFRANAAQIALMGLLLMLINLAWVRIATLLFALFFSEAPPSLERLVQFLLFSPASLAFLIVGTAIGAGLAALTFTLSAISIPMLLDRDVGLFTAVATSVVAVRANLAPMLLWAALVVIFTVLGLATLTLGLVVAMPLIGHATWHAYRDMVE